MLRDGSKVEDEFKRSTGALDGSEVYFAINTFFDQQKPKETVDLTRTVLDIGLHMQFSSDRINCFICDNDDDDDDGRKSHHYRQYHVACRDESNYASCCVSIFTKSN